MNIPINWSAREKPYTYLKRALDLFKKINGKIIVELGSMRVPLTHDINDYTADCCMDGHSSIILALECPEFYTVDLNKDTADLVTTIFKEFGISEHAHAIHGDGIDFLTRFDKKIDMLFLDAWDIDHPDSADNHLKAFKACEDKLSPGHIILIDDTDVFVDASGNAYASDGSNGGKGAILVPYLLSNGYKLLFTGRQTCLSKNI
jgi:hypothetical protein